MLDGILMRASGAETPRMRSKYYLARVAPVWVTVREKRQ
ncbi:hypothetical protein BACT_0392 [Bifidobacterium actinocoloniiforme DSM 22766]|uniref:Uncharacterized protein n=1 Tax=Bifidobacterium actinocoloniiforme DSM 22766 TaxID=1437605 RepID=A0A086YZJ2_9BIFI|nr:hypothetical protein BACT_0392 [Bifidobacterium actinocoloniiforme DSM 22766]